MKINVKRLENYPENWELPQYASNGAACFDLRAIHSGAVFVGQGKTFSTGLSFEIPKGYVMLIYSRSGHGFKHGVRLSNCTGVIDSDYRGEVKVKLYNDSMQAFPVKAGDRIAQAMILPIPAVELVEAEELSETERGQGGFGSTGT